MNYLLIDFIGGAWTLSAKYEDQYIDGARYIGYSLREAIRRFRQEYGLVGKHLVQIDLR